LFADGITQDGFQMPGIDDIEIATLNHLRLTSVQLAWPMAALAPDGKTTPSDGLLVQVRRKTDWLDLVGVAEETLGNDGSIKMRVHSIESRRECPALLSGVPGDGRLEQTTVVLNEERDSLSPRTNRVAGLSSDLRDDLSCLVDPNLPVERAPVSLVDRES
jgi:hypothetical protein